MEAKGKVLIVCSNADTFVLADGTKEPTGFYLNELAIPAQALVDAGYEIVLVTPDGKCPVVDRHSIAAHHFGGSEVALQKARDFVATNSGLQNPRSIRSVIAEGLDEYLGVFVPGGHPPMVDLMQNSDLGEVLRDAHVEGKPTALLCHGPIAAIASMPKAKEFRQAMVDGDLDEARIAAKGWQYAGFKMTVFSNDEERWVEKNLMRGGKVPFFVADALEVAGAIVTTTCPFGINVIQARELITGQNPSSDHRTADLFLQAIDRYAAWKSAPEFVV